MTKGIVVLVCIASAIGAYHTNSIFWLIPSLGSVLFALTMRIITDERQRQFQEMHDRTGKKFD